MEHVVKIFWLYFEGVVQNSFICRIPFPLHTSTYHTVVRFLILDSFSSSLNGLPEFFLTEAIQSFTSRLQEELNTTDLYSYRKVIDNISSCMENFDLGKPAFLCIFFLSLHHSF